MSLFSTSVYKEAAMLVTRFWKSSDARAVFVKLFQHCDIVSSIILKFIRQEDTRFYSAQLTSLGSVIYLLCIDIFRYVVEFSALPYTSGE